MEVHGFEEAQPETPWCIQCGLWLKWPDHDECLGCLTQGVRPAETVNFRTVHYDTAVLHQVIRRKRDTWERRHPGWELVPDMQRWYEESTHPSKYVDRETTIGRKLAWTRFRVERRHPYGVPTVPPGEARLLQACNDLIEIVAGLQAGLVYPPPPMLLLPDRAAYPFDHQLLGQGVTMMSDHPSQPEPPVEPSPPSEEPDEGEEGEDTPGEPSEEPEAPQAEAR